MGLWDKIVLGAMLISYVAVAPAATPYGVPCERDIPISSRAVGGREYPKAPDSYGYASDELDEVNA
ncbi:MAG: hypothetical protein MMC33_002394 [Icmadophila ericetorum]|nr:hypothetical protein [Icmadophila ericetorum]